MAKRQTSRRDFLSGHVAGARNSSVDHIADSRIEETYLEHYSKNAMACEFAVLLNMHQYSGGADATMKAFQLIDQLEQQLSIYRDDSEVSVLNRDASKSPQPVEPSLYQLLQLAADISSSTKGAFDITSGPLSNLWGFNRREGKVPTQTEIETSLKSISHQHVKLVADRQLLLQNAASINLGGIGKGYALDIAAQLMREHGINDFVFHGGQSSVVARGSQEEPKVKDAPNPNKASWTIGLSHPALPDTRLAEIYLTDEALGTSGTGRQGFFHDGKRYGHIIDPRTGWPTDHCMSATVIADRAAICDALATAFFVMQPNEVAEYCEQHKQIKAILVLPDGPAGKTKIESFNLLDEDWRLLQQ